MKKMQKKTIELFAKNMRARIFNRFSTRITDYDSLRALIYKLHPVCCDKKLIRLGPKGDGGYLVPNDFDDIEACFSPGVGMLSGFEKDCADMGIKIFLADKSVEQPAEGHRLFHFTKKFIGVTQDENFITLNNWVNSALANSKSDLILQLDVEGFEYEIFLSASDSLMNRLRIIVVEFHGLQQLWNFPYFKIVSRVFEKILQTHTCLHIHPNNDADSLQFNGLDIPQAMEFTFLRNDRIENPFFQNIFPHPLDYDCTNARTLILPECWYRKD